MYVKHEFVCAKTSFFRRKKNRKGFCNERNNLINLQICLDKKIKVHAIYVLGIKWNFDFTS